MRVFSILTVYSLITWAPSLWGAEELLVRSEIQVYSEASTDSVVLITLGPGDKVPISSLEYGAYRKVLIETGGRKRVGFVLQEQVEKSRVREKKASRLQASDQVYHQRMGIGLPLALSYMTQSGWKFASGDGSATEISSMSGMAIFFGFSFDLPLTSQWVFHSELNFRKTNMVGTTQPVGGSSKEVERTISFIGLGGGAKYYLSEKSNFWMGAGAELAKANNVTLIYAGTDTVPVAESDYPTYFLLKAGMGYDFPLFDNIYLNPQIRALMAINTSPAVLGAEGVLTFAYAF